MIRVEAKIKNKQYHECENAVLADLSLHCAAGEFISLIGPSGAGKSTLLNILGGLDQDFQGEVAFITSEGERERKDCRLAYLFQEPRLMPWLSIRENIALVRESDRNYQQSITELLEEVELASVADSFPLQLSGGMQRRVALARALAIEPEIILMDEPFVSLDEPTANRLRDELLQRWQKTRASIIFVTHNLDEAIRLSDRLIFLSTHPASVIRSETIDIPRPRPRSAVMNLQDHLREALPQLLGMPAEI